MLSQGKQKSFITLRHYACQYIIYMSTYVILCQLAQLVFLLVLSLSQDYERQSSVSDQLKSNRICGEKALCTMSVDKLLDLDCSVLKTLNHFSG